MRDFYQAFVGHNYFACAPESEFNLYDILLGNTSARTSDLRKPSGEPVQVNVCSCDNNAQVFETLVKTNIDVLSMPVISKRRTSSHNEA